MDAPQQPATRHTLILTPPLQTSYVTWGSGPPVILLHGLADHGLVWQGLANALGDRYQFIAPDLRGHGESSKPAESEYDARQIANDLEQLAQHLNLPAVQVIAHSWAAKVALVWGQQTPNRISRLLLVDPFFVNKFAPIWKLTFPLLYRTLPFLKVMGPFDTYDSAQAIAQNLKQYQGWSPAQAAAFKASVEEKPDGTWGSKFSVAARNGVFLDTLKVAGLTQPVDIPTVLVLPKQGLNRSQFQRKPYLRYLTHLTIEDVPGNHWPHLVEPTAFNQAIQTALNNA